MFLFWVLGLLCCLTCENANAKTVIEAIEFLKNVNEDSSKLCNTMSKKAWNFNTNITDVNKKLMIAQSIINKKYHNEVGKNASAFPWRNFDHLAVKRQFKFITDIGTAILDEAKIKKLAELEADMEENYSKSKICEYTPDPFSNRKCDLTLEPDLTRILKTSENYDELKHVWTQWREKAGKPVRNKFIEMVKLQNEAAVLNGFTDAGESLRDNYEAKNFPFIVQELWEKLRPLYRQIHAYTRKKLIKIYGEDKISRTGPIPAHLLGNMWAQSWGNLAEKMMPFPGKPKVDITDILVQKRYTARDIFNDAEEFFVSLGLDPMPKMFWEKSMIVKPSNREVVCHASAWDFCDSKDVRIKQCTDITMEDFVVTHHEMGHIQYYLLYANQPYLFRDGANPGFHEAFGDLLALSVVTPKHLHSIGLLTEYADDKEGDLNFLFSLAMEKIVFLPFGFLMDQWRWKVYNGEITEKNLNEKWWELRLLYQGIVPPVSRSEEDFDPGAKYHISANVPYIRYFVAAVLQFQFHETLCRVSGHTGPLHKCDIYKSKEAGQRLRDVLSLGSSIHWKDQMRIMTGGATNKMDASSIITYFQPLIDWLEKENEGEKIGWEMQGSDSSNKPSDGDNGSSMPMSSLNYLSFFIITAAYFIVSDTLIF